MHGIKKISGAIHDIVQFRQLPNPRQNIVDKPTIMAEQQRMQFPRQH